MGLGQKITDFWRAYEKAILVFVGCVMLGVLSFELGYIEASKRENGPMIIEKCAPSASQEVTALSASSGPNGPAEAKNGALGLKQEAIDSACSYVGSRNSDKYHLPSCQWAKRIKPANSVCYASDEDARAKGKTPDAACVK